MMTIADGTADRSDQSPSLRPDEALPRGGISNSEGDAQPDRVENEAPDDDVEVTEEEIRFPRSLLKRIIKERLVNSGVTANRDEFDPSKVQISKNCLEAFDEAAKLFIHYVTWSAGEELRKTKRQTMGVEDVLSGLEEAEYGELVGPLRLHLADLQAGKKRKIAGAS